MLMPGNVVKVYKKEVLDNLVSGWNKVGFLSCKIYMEKELGRMKIKSIKILKTSYLVLIPNQVGQL